MKLEAEKRKEHPAVSAQIQVERAGRSRSWCDPKQVEISVLLITRLTMASEMMTRHNG